MFPLSDLVSFVISAVDSWVIVANYVNQGIELVATSKDQDEIAEALKNIAAAHTIIVTAVTGKNEVSPRPSCVPQTKDASLGIVLLQVAHYLCMKRWAREDAASAKHSKKHKHKAH
jgi:hypothetical protein